MKKRLFIMLAGMLLVTTFMAGCSNKDSALNGKGNSDVEATEVKNENSDVEATEVENGNSDAEATASDSNDINDGNSDLTSADSSGYPQIVYIEDVLYYNTKDECEMVPKRMPDGKIETFVAKEIMPDSYNSANFGSEYGSLEFMFLEDDGLIVHVGDKWYYFTNSQD